MESSITKRMFKKLPKVILDLERGYRYSMNMYTSTGFPVTVWLNIEPPDCSVGIMRSYVDDYCITTRRGYACDWLKLSEEEEARLVDAVSDLLVTTYKYAGGLGG